MKFLFTAILMILFCPLFGQTNYSINSGGGEALGQQGNYSYSIGQIFATQVFKEEGQIDSGVQQGFIEEVPESNTQVIDSVGLDYVLIPIPIVDSVGVDFNFNPIIDSVALDIIAYPNPVVDILYVNMGYQEFENLTFQVFDFGGKLIKKGILENTISEIQLDYIRSGIYLLVVANNDERVYSLKIIKK